VAERAPRQGRFFRRRYPVVQYHHLLGWLTLNVLLSFAQFEREVIGECIRDKVAASKRKGRWMGGVLLSGSVEHYLELDSVRRLGNDLPSRMADVGHWIVVCAQVKGRSTSTRGV
jgi:hypothetical protein